MLNDRRLVWRFRPICIVEWLIIIAVVILVGGNVGTHDYTTFMQSYNNIINPSFEAGYLWLEDLFQSSGVAYNTFRLLICAFSVIVAYAFSRKYDVNSSLFLLLYFLYPLTHDGAYLRNTIAKCIVYIAMQVAMDKGLLKKIVSIALIILATQFHRIAIIYIIPLLIWFFLQISDSARRKRFVKVVLSVVVIFAIAAALYRPLLNFVLSYMTSMSMFAGNKQIYLSVAGNFGFVIMGGIQAGCTAILYLCYKQLKEYNSGNSSGMDQRTVDHNLRCERFVYLVFIFCTTLLFMIAVYKVNSNYFRVFRNLFPLAIIAVLSCFKITKGTNLRREQIIRWGFIALLAICFVVDIMSSRTQLWDSMFTNNWIFSGNN